MVAEHRAGNTPDAKSLDDLYNGCTTVQSETIKMSVGFARFFLFAKSDIQKATYLMQDVKNFLHLIRWEPASELQDLEPFVTEDTEWKKVNLRIIVAGSYLISKADSKSTGVMLIDLVVNTTVKKVLMHFQELREILLSAENTEGMNKILKNVLLEMFSCKLGTTISIDLTEDDITAVRDETGVVGAWGKGAKAQVRKVIAAHCSKTGGMHAHSIVFHDRARCPRDPNLGLANTYRNCSLNMRYVEVRSTVVRP
jgi:hypothetical protein